MHAMPIMGTEGIEPSEIRLVRAAQLPLCDIPDNGNGCWICTSESLGYEPNMLTTAPIRFESPTVWT